MKIKAPIVNANHDVYPCRNRREGFTEEDIGRNEKTLKDNGIVVHMHLEHVAIVLFVKLKCHNVQLTCLMWSLIGPHVQGTCIIL